MTLSLTLNSVSLPLPDAESSPWEQEEMVFGAGKRMANGSLRVDYRTTKQKITLHWAGLSHAERDAVQAAWLGAIATARTLVLPDGQSFSVMCGMNAFTSTPWYDIDSVPWYRCNLVCEEA